jgi:nitronate monooxygenase
MNNLPVIIQGGMGAGVSNWRLAQAVSTLGQLGVVSGTALDQILVRRLQDGDPGGHMRRGFDAFPFHALSEPIWQQYFNPGGRAPNTPYRTAPQHAKDNPREVTALCIVSNFVEVYLARQGHSNPVGINYLEKIQTANLPCIYGAMLAGVGYVLMGAGIPLKIPGVLDRLAKHLPTEYALHVAGAFETDDNTMHFDPRDFIGGPLENLECPLETLERPLFLSIVSSNTLATTMLRKANGSVDGFVIEMPSAGGHNAPPRGKLLLSDSGEPIYGDRDAVDLAKLRELNVPFWLAGSYGRPEKLREALAAGATGVQVGTAFEFANESGLDSKLKQAILSQIIDGWVQPFTDPLASPTGFPFKVIPLEGTDVHPTPYADRPRICDLGFLRQPYRTAEGAIGYRCPSEPVSLYLSKGGDIADTIGRKCLCNGLLANIGQAQLRGSHHVEPPLVTAGDDLNYVANFLPPDQQSYAAADVIAALLQPA